jgi:hypothetical protein
MDTVRYVSSVVAAALIVGVVFTFVEAMYYLLLRPLLKRMNVIKPSLTYTHLAGFDVCTVCGVDSNDCEGCGECGAGCGQCECGE